MSTYTPSLGLEEITPGDQAGLWGNTTNNNLALIDQAVTGVTPISFTGASGTTVTLTDFNGATDEARSAVLNITGIATGSNNVVVPNKQKTYLVRNNTGQDVVFKTATPGDTYTVGSGYSILIFCDGNNNVYTGIQSPSVGTLPVSAGGTGVATFTAGFVKSAGGTTNLTTSSSINLSSEVSNVLPVANGGTGAGTFTSGTLLIGNGTGNFGTLSGGTAGYVATWNGSTWVASAPASSAVTSVFGRTSAVTAQSGDYSSYYYPLSSNPANYVTSSTLSGYAPLSSPAFTGSVGIGAGGSGGGFNLYVVGQSGQSAAVFYSNAGSGSSAMGTNVQGSNTFNMVIQNNTTNVGSITTTSTTTAFNTTSDRRLKSNISTLTNSGPVIDAIQPRTFTWKSNGESAVGFIADELQQVVPSAVHGEPNAVDEKGEPIYQGVDASTPEMIALMIAELQSLRKRVAELEVK